VPVLHVNHDSNSSHCRGYCLGYNVAQTLMRSIINSIQKSGQDLGKRTQKERRARSRSAVDLELIIVRTWVLTIRLFTFAMAPSLL
jgi:hypothetical protein